MKTVLAFALILLIAKSPVIAQPDHSIREVPADTANLIDLIDTESGDNPELLYGWLMSPDKRPEGESTNVELREAVERLMHRASGYTLKFAFNRWSGLSARQKEGLTEQQVAFAFQLLENQDFVSLTKEGWGRKLPYRFRFETPTGLLRGAQTNATDLITAQLDHQLAIVRAAAVDILGVRCLRELPVANIPHVKDRLLELADDESSTVRAAVATALGMVPASDPARFVVALRGLAADDEIAVRMPAFLSIRSLAKHIPEDFAVAIAGMVRDNGLDVQARIASALEVITETAAPETCDAIIDEVFPLLDPADPAKRNRAIKILCFAARNSSRDQCERTAKAMIDVIAASNDIDEMLAIFGVGPLGKQLTEATRWEVIDELLHVIEGPAKDREVRIRQSATAAIAIVPYLEDQHRLKVTPRMIPMLDRKAKAQAAALVIGSVGPSAQDAVPKLRQLASANPSWTSVIAARALWDVQPDAELCGRAFVRALATGSDMTHKHSEWGLVAMGDEAIVVLDDLIKLLDHKKAYGEALEVIANLGAKASKAESRVKPFLDSPSLPASKAARRALDSYQEGFVH